MEKESSTPALPELPNLQQRNIDAIAKVESAVMGERSAGERFARFVIRRIGTPTAVCIHVAFFALWIAWNAAARDRVVVPFDPYPFNLLALVASVEAIVLGLLILSSQNRLQHEADRRAHLNLQINMMAELEGTKVLTMLDKLCRHFDIDSDAGELLAELTADTDPATIVETIKTTMPAEE